MVYLSLLYTYYVLVVNRYLFHGLFDNEPLGRGKQDLADLPQKEGEGLDAKSTPSLSHYQIAFAA